MSDSEGDDSNFKLYGTPLEAFDEDEIPRKKPINVEDQIVTDENGRRRFHGAFTGGFSAGFYNTVGSLEGWKPSEFKSSRQNKPTIKVQSVEDFMDAEDLGEFGIAHRTVKNTQTYGGTSRKRKVFKDSTIPGEPVLFMLLKPADESIGVKLLKKMGWKVGQGIGPRVSAAIKNARRRRANEVLSNNLDEELEDDGRDDVTFAPDNFDVKLENVKENTMGLGFKGLNRATVSAAPERKFMNFSTKNKTLSIAGQAFGVGALEDDDDDIYANYDMTKYDFTLDDGDAQSKQLAITGALYLDMFSLRKTRVLKKVFPPPILPKYYKPSRGRVSRFEPIQEEKGSNNEETVKFRRNQMTVQKRQELLKDDENVNDELSTNERDQESEQANDNEFEEEIKKYGLSFKRLDREQKLRFKQYCELLSQAKEHMFKTIMPFGLTEWQQLQEKVLFDRILLRPTEVISDRFVRASEKEEEEKSGLLHGTVDKRNAAKMKMFGKLTRDVGEWVPCGLLCKRFNVPEPKPGRPEPPKSTQRGNLLRNVPTFIQATVGEKSNDQSNSKRGENSKDSKCQQNATNQTEKPNEKLNNSEQKTIKIPPEVVREIEETAVNNQPIPEVQAKPQQLDNPSIIRSKNKLDEVFEPFTTVKNIDLFKDIFCDSSSDDDDDGDKNDVVDPKLNNSSPVAQNENEQTDKLGVQKDKIEKKIESAHENFSRPTGIFSNLHKVNSDIKRHTFENPKKIEKQKEQIKKSGNSVPKFSENVSDSHLVSSSNLYGPSLPSERSLSTQNSSSNPSTSNKITTISDSSSDSDAWVEKSKKSSHKKHRKKDKKEKVKKKKSFKKKDKKFKSKHRR